MAFSIDGRGVLRFEPWLTHPWLVHGFSTQATGDFRSRTGAESGELAGVEGPIVTLKQIHSDLVLRADGTVAPVEPRPEGDALISASAGETIGVRIADCLPLLLVDPARRAVAAVHAGWRGSAAHIAAAAVECLRTHYASWPADIEAVIGPCISADAYEVDEDVAAHFEARAVLRRPDRPRPHVDLAAANRLQLESAGLCPENIYGGGFCSFSEALRFHSHRRDGESAGRMMAFVGLR
jgi:YfiH family protein